jgi:hypothetical protein
MKNTNQIVSKKSRAACNKRAHNSSV